MKLTYRHPTDADKREICAWRYEGEYAMYDLPPYEEMREMQMGFLNPVKEKNFYVFLDDTGLVGFVNIAEEETEVFIGIGTAPYLCGKGYGHQMLLDAYELSQSLYPQKPLYLEVRCWNERAMKCYQKAGFQIDGEAFEQETHIGAGKFYRMIHK